MFGVLLYSRVNKRYGLKRGVKSLCVSWVVVEGLVVAPYYKICVGALFLTFANMKLQMIERYVAKRA